MRNPHYLFLSRHNLYYFRFPLPATLHPQGKATAIKLSLNTRSPSEALQIARGLIYFGQIALTQPALCSMDYHEIRDVLQSHFQRMRDAIKEQIGKRGQLTAQDVAAYSQTISLAQNALDQQDFTVIGDDTELQELIGQYNLPISGDAADYTTFRTEYLKGYKSYCESILELNSRYDRYNFSTAPEARAMRTAKKLTASIKLKDTLLSYKKEKIRDKEWTNATIPFYESKYNLLVEYLGTDCSLHISPETAEDVVRMLRLMPKNIRKMKDTRNLTIMEAIKLGLPTKRLMHKKTYASYIDAYKSFYDWALKRKLVEENHFKSFTVKKDKGQVKDAFTKEQIAMILNELRTNQLKTIQKPFQKWGSLINIFTGARLNEIAQLDVADIKQIEGIWCFDLNEQGDKQLKNKNSARIVPVHAELLNDGLIEFRDTQAREGKVRLFPDLPYCKKNGHGRKLGQWFNNTLLPALAIDSAKLTFHSSRHSIFTYLVHAGVTQSLAMALSGHTQKGVFNEVYFKGYTVKQLKEAIDLVYRDMPDIN